MKEISVWMHSMFIKAIMALSIVCTVACRGVEMPPDEIEVGDARAEVEAFFDRNNMEWGYGGMEWLEQAEQDVLYARKFIKKALLIYEQYLEYSVYFDKTDKVERFYRKLQLHGL